MPYPRAAIGYTRDNHLILFATDGKQPFISMGLTLARLAEEMKKLGCVEAMNLDGGGSETLVLDGRAINHPSDGRERRITSIFAIVPAAAENAPPIAATP
jgi:exopolysaccharide biosynthesis protein